MDGSTLAVHLAEFMGVLEASICTVGLVMHALQWGDAYCGIDLLL